MPWPVLQPAWRRNGRDATGAAARSRPCRVPRAPTRAPPAIPAARSGPWPFNRRQASDVEGFAATAAALLVRVLEDEARFQLLFLVVHHRADQEQRRLGIDQEL